MKIVFYSILLSSIIFSESLNINLVGNLTFDQECSDITGFALDGREIAVIGLYNGTAFVDITNPQNPFELNRIPGDGSIWRDVKYWDNKVYIGTEADMGLQVVDVSNLEDIHLVHTISDFDNSHNIHVWEGYLFVVGADEYDIWIYDLSTQGVPVLVGTWNEEYLHDIDVYNNKIYGMGINSSTAYIIDISDITNPTTLVSWNYPGMAHDAAVFPNEQFLATADEMEGGHLKIWDISDYNNITEISSVQINSAHSLHNIYIKNDLIFGSWYADGTRVHNISDPYNPVEVGFYDTTEIEGLYVGNWGTYINLPSGLIISSDIESGLYILEMGLSVNHEDITGVNINQDIPIDIDISMLSGEVYLAQIFYKDYFGEWTSEEMEVCSTSGNSYCIILSSYSTETILNYYFYVENSLGQTVVFPTNGEENPFNLEIGEISLITADYIESGNNWTIGEFDDDATSGIWEYGIPNGVFVQSGGAYSQPNNDNTFDGENCFITGNYVDGNEGSDDIDGGKTTLISPFFIIENADEVLFSFAYWFSNNLGNNPGSDIFEVDFRDSYNSEWTSLFSTNLSTNYWTTKDFFLSNYLNEFNQIQFRFVASDYLYPEDNSSGGSLVEAGIDDLIFKALYENILYGDANLDDNVDVTDLILMVNFILGNIIPLNDMVINSDINNDGLINITDIVSVVNIILY
ncbi:MAG: hypothetical protein CMF96_11630 [Candidatus Marinimicrobia bacterium]|nr:hypothetical protein [Candidatus Neomarinimicrobiota bacterium]